MFTQADAAERILQDANGPMHYIAIVDKAVKLGLIERTANNTDTLYANVRKALATDTRFVKTTKGTFNLTSRQGDLPQQADEREEHTDMSTPEAKNGIPEFQAIREELKSKGAIEIEMKRLRDACGWGSIKKYVVEDIHTKMAAHGLGHVPTDLPMSQNEVVLVYELSGLVGKVVEVVRAEAGTSDKYKAMVDKIREITEE